MPPLFPTPLLRAALLLFGDDNATAERVGRRFGDEGGRASRVGAPQAPGVRGTRDGRELGECSGDCFWLSGVGCLLLLVVLVVVVVVL